MTPVDHTLDCKNLNCPMPIVRISREIKDLEPGKTLEVQATDPAFTADVIAWAKKTGNELLEVSGGEVQRAIIRKVS